MVKIDPYKHEERWNRWKKRTTNEIIIYSFFFRFSWITTAQNATKI